MDKLFLKTVARKNIITIFAYTNKQIIYTMMSTERKIERIKEINDFILNQSLTKVQLEKYLIKLDNLKKEFTKFDRNYYQLDLPEALLN